MCAAEQRAAVKAAAATAIAALHAHRTQHNEHTCQLLQLVGQDDLPAPDRLSCGWRCGEWWGCGGCGACGLGSDGML
jgi:hypothetical protein